MSDNCWKCAQEKVGGTPCDLHSAALPPVRSEPSLAEAIAAIKALVEALECYTSVHGADEDDEQALALGRDVLRKANARLDRQEEAAP